MDNSLNVFEVDNDCTAAAKRFLMQTGAAAVPQKRKRTDRLHIDQWEGLALFVVIGMPLPAHKHCTASHRQEWVKRARIELADSVVGHASCRCLMA